MYDSSNHPLLAKKQAIHLSPVLFLHFSIPLFYQVVTIYPARPHPQNPSPMYTTSNEVP
jgi:hypothetical protein